MNIKRTKIDRAKEVNLFDYCEYKGIELTKDDNNDNYRVIGNQGLIIRDNFFWHGDKREKHDSIAFVQKVLGIGFKEAVNELLSYQRKQGNEMPSASRQAGGSGAELEKKEVKGEFVLPVKAPDNKRVFAYLTKTRGLPQSLVNEMIDRGLLYQDYKGNCVFVCYDELGNPSGAILRGSRTDKVFKGWAVNSNAEYGWLIKPEKQSGTVFVTESPIDALSYFAYYPSIRMREFYYLALGGLNIGAIEKFLSNHEEVKRIVLGIDTDEAAQKRFESIRDRFSSEYEIVDSRPKEGKDWNEALLKRV